MGLLIARCLCRLVVAFVLAVPLGGRTSARPLASVALTQVANDTDTAFLVPVSIGPLRDLWFLVDTAATRSVITPSVRNRLGLPGTQASFDDITGAGGRISAQGYILPAIAVGGAVQRDLRVVVVDLARRTTWIGRSLDGILGADFLRNYDVRMDGPSGTFELHAPSGTPETKMGDAVAFSRIPFEIGSRGFAVIPVRVNGRPLRGVLDTGASRSVLNNLGATLAGVSSTAGKAIETLGADCNPVRLTFERAGSIVLGTIEFTDEIVSVGDLPMFESLGLDSEPSVILGAGSVRDRVVFISYGTNTLFLSREKSPPAGRQVSATTGHVSANG